MATRKIKKAVGDRDAKTRIPAANSPDDVRVVQRLLKRQNVYGGIVDGDCGKQTIAAIRLFQQRKMGSSKPDGRVDPSGNTLLKLNQLSAGSRDFKIRTGRNFLRIADGRMVDPVLYYRCNRLCQYLIDNDIVVGDIYMTQGMRSPKKAHRWSTAWNIRQERVPLKNLQDLENGKDKDGNVWYKTEWEHGLKKDSKGEFTAASRKMLWRRIKKNARTYWTGSIAAEGYELKDPKIKPNVHKKVSNHCTGQAMDISIPWKPGAQVRLRTKTGRIINGQNTDAMANALVAAFGLSRPVRSEKWHFQLAVTAKKNFSDDYLRTYIEDENWRIA